MCASSEDKRGLTSVEAAADGGDHNLQSEKTSHGEKDIAVLLVDGINTNNVHD